VSRMAPNIFAIAHFVGRVKYDFTDIIERNKDGMTAGECRVVTFKINFIISRNL